MKFRRQHDPKYKGSKQLEDYSDCEILTVPDQSLSLKKLLKDHTRMNAVIATAQKGIFTEDTVIPNYEDRIDFIQDKRETELSLKNAENEIQQKIKTRQDKAKISDAERVSGSDKGNASEKDKADTEIVSAKGGGEA